MKELRSPETNGESTILAKVMLTMSTTRLTIGIAEGKYRQP